MFKRRTRGRSAGQPAARRPGLLRRLLAAAGVLAVLWLALWALNRPIRDVRVSGSFEHVTPPAVERAVAAQAEGSGILTVNLARVRAAVDALPWVARSSVSRIWPDELAVRVHEQVALAGWNGHGLVNRAGKVFLRGPASVPPGLPSLSGPRGTSQQVTRRYLRMSGQLEPEGFSIASLTLDARGTWQFTLNDGITVRLGRSQLAARFEKFVNVALAIVKRRAGDISYIDMRYMNGFAIGWRTGAPRDLAPARLTGAGGRDA
ncbi:MAG: cell division protein FtsQ/DivIB [Steroidobacteraceae bacterium]